MNSLMTNREEPSLDVYSSERLVESLDCSIGIHYSLYHRIGLTGRTREEVIDDGMKTTITSHVAYKLLMGHTFQV